jgi:hypothetical protein
MTAFTVEALQLRHLAVQYNGSNLPEVRELLSKQDPPGQVTILNGTITPFVRRPDLPDQPLLRGDALMIVEATGVVHHASKLCYEQLYRPVTP